MLKIISLRSHSEDEGVLIDAQFRRSLSSGSKAALIPSMREALQYEQPLEYLDRVQGFLQYYS